MSKYTFIDGYGNERPMPHETDNDEAQYHRGEICGGVMYEEGEPYADELASFAHDLKCKSFKKGWCLGWITMAAANGDLPDDFERREMPDDPIKTPIEFFFDLVRRATPNDKLAKAVLAGEY